jgi:hypothetical protein
VRRRRDRHQLRLARRAVRRHRRHCRPSLEFLEFASEVFGMGARAGVGSREKKRWRRGVRGGGTGGQ